MTSFFSLSFGLYTLSYGIMEIHFTFACILRLKQEHSYCNCKQVARQLRTQYDEGINSNPVTLKSRLRLLKVIGKGTVG